MKTPSEFSAEPATSIELAQSLTAALNAYDADAVVQLFGEEDSGPTVTADRYAWGKLRSACGCSNKSKPRSISKHTTTELSRSAQLGMRMYTARIGANWNTHCV